MPKFFPGITHTIVKTPKDIATMEKLEGLATVRLCFTTDEDFIVIKIKKMEGPTSGVSAIVPCVPGTVLSAMYGKVANEAKLEALMAFDRVKQKFGIKFGKKYKVTLKDVVEIGGSDAVNLPGVGA